MKPLAKIFFYLFASLLLGVIIAPLIYQLVQLFPSDETSHFSHLMISVQQMPFHRYVSRCVQIAALLLLWPTISWLRIQHFSELSLSRNPRAFADLGYGILVAIVPLWFLEALFLWKGWYFLNDAFSLTSFLRIVGTAAIVAIFEEFFFRGLLLGLSRRFLKNEAAIFFTALLFASVHFLNMPHGGKEIVHWWSGLALCCNVGSGLPAWPLFLGAFVTLLLLGIILAWVTVRTESLWLAIGLHAAWIFGQQSFNLLAHYNVTPINALLPWLGASQIYGMVPVGLLPLIPLAVTVLFLKRWLRGAISS